MITPYDRLVMHYQGILQESEELLQVAIDGQAKAEVLERWEDVKIYTKLKHELQSIIYQHEEGFKHWKEKQQNYIHERK